MKRYFFAGDCRFDIYLLNPISVRFDEDDPHVRVFSSKKARDSYVRKTHGACPLTARIARPWVNNYTWAETRAWRDSHTVEDYLRRYPQNDFSIL